MFHLSKIGHTLHLHPQLLGLPLIDAIKGELEVQFLDKVIANLGLCISVYDILSIDGGFIFPGDGCSSYEVVARLVMFRPFVGEILTGKIEESNNDGLRLSLGFFNDIYVPVSQLQQPCKRGDDGIWLWDFESQDLPLDLNEEVHFQVRSVNYPPIPVKQDANSKPFAPMEIVVVDSGKVIDSADMHYGLYMLTSFSTSKTPTHIDSQLCRDAWRWFRRSFMVARLKSVLAKLKRLSKYHDKSDNVRLSGLGYILLSFK